MDKKHVLYQERYFGPSVSGVCIVEVETHWKSFWQTILGVLYLFLENSENEKIFAWHVYRNLCH